MKRTSTIRRMPHAAVRSIDARKSQSHMLPASCLAVLTVAWLGSAIAPMDRHAWFLESLLVLVFVPILVLDYRWFRFSDRAYVHMTAFLLMHVLGSQYTYSDVPVGEWFREAFGLARNHYDRFVHLAFGVLAFRPVREIAFRTGREPGVVTTALLISSAVVALGVAYELIEWLAAAIVDPEAGTAFLGTQGDDWDAQKDLALAGVGALLVGILEMKSPLRPTTRVPLLVSIPSSKTRRAAAR